MHMLTRAIFLLLAWLPPTLLATADLEVQIADRHPAAGQVIAVDTPLYLRLAYRSETPVRFQLRSSGDASLSAAMNPAPVYPAGTGEALVWLAQRKPQFLDTATLLVFDEQWRELEAIDVSLRARWGMGSATGPEPDWVTALRQDQQDRLGAAAATGRNGGDGQWLVQLMALSVPGYLILQVLAWRRWHHSWRTAGRLPLWVAVPLIAFTVALLAAGSNLWPAMLLLVMPFLFLYLLVLLVARHFALRGQR